MTTIENLIDYINTALVRHPTFRKYKGMKVIGVYNDGAVLLNHDPRVYEVDTRHLLEVMVEKEILEPLLDTLIEDYLERVSIPQVRSIKLDEQYKLKVQVEDHLITVDQNSQYDFIDENLLNELKDIHFRTEHPIMCLESFNLDYIYEGAEL